MTQEKFQKRSLAVLTVEMDHDETMITLMDTTSFYEDVQFIIYDDIVYIRQFDDDNMTLIEMSPNMFDSLIAAMNLPEGAYVTK